MGGSLKIVIKKEDKYNFNEVWTNPMPSLIKNDQFIELDSDYMNHKYFKMSNDIEDRNFAFSEYGIDVFDLDNKTIISAQGYCSYSDISGSSISLYVNGNVIDGIDKTDKNYYPSVFRRMYEKGMLNPIKRTYNKKDNDEWEVKVEEVNDFNLDKYFKSIKGWKYKKDLTFEINWEKFGWKLLNYHEDDLKLVEYLYDNYKVDDISLNSWKDYHLERSDQGEDYIIDFFQKLKVKERKRKLIKINGNYKEF